MAFLNRRRVRNFSIALSILIGAAWIVPSYFSAERYRRRLQAGLERALHRPVKFGAVSFRLIPRPGFSIENAEIDEDPDFGSEPFARIDRIDCDLRWHSLWRSRMDFAHLHLESPSFNVVLNSHGKWNVEKLLVQSGVTGAAGGGTVQAPSASADQLNLEVADARINFQIGPNKKPFALTEVRAGLQVSPAERRVQFQIVANPVRSDLAIPSPGPVEANGTWMPGADLRGPIDAYLRTRGALLYDWIPVVSGINPQIYGVIDADVHLTGSLPDLKVEGESHLTQMQRWEDLPPSELMPWTIRFAGRLAGGRERVQVESLEATFGDSHLHMSGTVEKVQSAPQLDLVVALERSRLEDAFAVIRRFWPNFNTWSLKGRIDAMLAVQGEWKQRRYGGFLGAQSVSLETPSGSFPVSDIAITINSSGAVMAPVRIALATRVALTASGAINRASAGPRYELQLMAKNVPLHEALSFGRELGIRDFHGIDATGSATASIDLAGAAWPLARPVLTARSELRAARFLIPGLTEPLNVPHANVQVNGDQITADSVVAVMGTSVFKANLVHQGARTNPWSVNLHANGLRLEQAALWFDALGLRQPVPLLERLPGIASFAARHEAAAQILGRLNALVRFETPSLSYRGVMLTDFRGNFEVAGRTLRMTTASFRAAAGRGEAEGALDFTSSPPIVSARASLAAASLPLLTASLPGPLRRMRGSVNASANFQSRGLARPELAQNLTGRVSLRIKDIAWGNFDPLGTLADDAGWGRLERVGGPVTLGGATLNLQIRDHLIILQPAAISVNGANLQVAGDYSMGGVTNLKVRADLRHLRRRWLTREDDPGAASGFEDVRLSGPIDRLAVNSREAVASVEGTAEGGER